MRGWIRAASSEEKWSVKWHKIFINWTFDKFYWKFLYLADWLMVKPSVVLHNVWQIVRFSGWNCIFFPFNVTCLVSKTWFILFSAVKSLINRSLGVLFLPQISGCKLDSKALFLFLCSPCNGIICKSLDTEKLRVLKLCQNSEPGKEISRVTN